MNTTRRIIVSSDHAAIELRLLVREYLMEQRFLVEDTGPKAAKKSDYPIQGFEAASRVASGEFDLGIVFCGTGQGIMMAANKVAGIRCGVCSDTYSAKMLRRHNDANMLSLGARVVGFGLALDIVEAFLQSDFEGGRHIRRIRLLDEKLLG